MERGAELLAIDSGDGYEDVQQLLADDPSLSEALGPAEEGVTRGFRYRLRDGAIIETVLVKAVYDVDPIPNDNGVQILPQAGTVGVGYLNLRSFVSTADAQLRDAFSMFLDAGISDFIIDLRYNGGGLVSTEEVFENLLAASLNGQVSHEMQFNEKHTDRNELSRFDAEPNAVQPMRIAFITSASTASASELLINSYAPYVQVAIVGADTYGKPVGQSAFDLDGCDTRLRLVSFHTVNAEASADYYDGLAETLDTACAALDDISHEQGHPAEDSTEKALAWLSGGQCTAGSLSLSLAKSAQPSMRLLTAPGVSDPLLQAGLR